MKKLQSFLISILVLGLVFVLASCGAKITPNEPFDMSEGVEMSEYREMQFTVCSYNIKGGEATVDSVTKIKNNIESVSADIAGLQEVDHLSNRTGKTDFLSIFKNNSLLNNVAYFSVDIKGFGDTYGLAQISTTPFQNSHRFKLPYPYVYEKTELEKRIIVRSLVKIDGVQIAFYNTHLSYENVKMPNGKSVRAEQMEYLTELLESDPCPYKIVTGDFNVLSFEEYNLLFERGYQIVNNANNKFDTYRGDDTTFNAIDNIIYSSKLQLVASGMVEADCSDHNMLHATFKTAI